MSYDGLDCPRESSHRIVLDGRTVMRDGRAVKVTIFRSSSLLRIGCTYVSRAAMQRLLDLYDTQVDGQVIQEGAE